MIIIGHASGVKRTRSLSVMVKVLSARDDAGFNEFNIRGTQENPSLNILANGDLASIHYFRGDRDPGLQSRSQGTGLSPRGATEFHILSTHDRWIAPNNAVVPFSLAVEAAKAFVASPDVPPAVVKWRAL